GTYVFVDKKGLGHRAGVGQAGRFNDHAVELQGTLLALARQVAQGHDQVATHRAADAAIVHFNDLLATVLHQDLVVDVFLAEFILDDGNAQGMVLAQDAVEEGGFARTEEAGQDGGGNEGHVLWCGRVRLDGSWDYAAIRAALPTSATGFDAAQVL